MREKKMIKKPALTQKKERKKIVSLKVPIGLDLIAFRPQAPMFKGLSDGFLRMLSLEIKPALYLPNQIIASRNEICHNMYYIQRGKVEVSSPYSSFDMFIRSR